MKKFLLGLVALLTLGISSVNISAEPATESEGPVCTQVGNVSVSIAGNTVHIQNYNSYTVNVTWSVYGTDENGKTRKIAGGTELLNKMNDNSTADEKDITITCPPGVTGLWISADSQKCK